MARRFPVSDGLWLAALVAGIGLPILYFLDPPLPFGAGWTRLVGWGGLIGIGCGLAIFRMRRTSFTDRSAWRKGVALAACAATGLFAGASGAAWLDQRHVVRAYPVELPIVTIVQPGPRPDRNRTRIATLAPYSPTHEDHVLTTFVRSRAIQPGDCLVGRMEHGWLGSAWVRAFTTRPCAEKRGPAGTHVLTMDADFASWRWHSPHDYKRLGPQEASDAALPADRSCRMAQGGWLYRCTKRAAGR